MHFNPGKAVIGWLVQRSHLLPGSLPLTFLFLMSCLSGLLLYCGFLLLRLLHIRKKSGHASEVDLLTAIRIHSSMLAYTSGACHGTSCKDTVRNSTAMRKRVAPNIAVCNSTSHYSVAAVSPASFGAPPSPSSQLLPLHACNASKSADPGALYQRMQELMRHDASRI